MAKFLIAYTSRTGHTKKIADYLAEGIRMSGHEVEVKNISELKEAADLEGYQGYLFGCPTYHRDMTASMKTFLFLVEQAKLAGKVGGAFGSYTHSGDAPGYIFDTMENVFKMDMTDLGSLNVIEGTIDTPDGIKAAQDYARAVGGKIAP